LGNTDSIHVEEWPVADQALAKDNEVTIGVQINGKVRGSVTIAVAASEEEAMQAIWADEQLAKRIVKDEIKKVIFVPGKILNIIC